jgi:hypothetical protein
MEVFQGKDGNVWVWSHVFNLDNLIQPAHNLAQLEAPFSKEEVDNVVANLPNNKSPGPDGFLMSL